MRQTCCEWGERAGNPKGSTVHIGAWTLAQRFGPLRAGAVGGPFPPGSANTLHLGLFEFGPAGAGEAGETLAGKVGETFNESY